MDESILTSVKNALGIVESYTHFDGVLINCINSVFAILTQLGAGPKQGFSISDKSTTWSSYMNDCPALQMVKTYMGMKVHLMWDNSTLPGPVIEVYNRQIAEFESRINYEVDPGPKDHGGIQNEE